MFLPKISILSYVAAGGGEHDTCANEIEASELTDADDWAQRPCEFCEFLLVTSLVRLPEGIPFRLLGLNGPAYQNRIL